MNKIFNRTSINVKINNKSTTILNQTNNYSKTKKTSSYFKTKKTNKLLLTDTVNSNKKLAHTILLNLKSYDYNKDYSMLDTILTDLRTIKLNRTNIINNYEYNKQVLDYTNEYTRNLAHYINYKYKTKVSNAYIKLWEIYETFNLVPKHKTTVKMFHIAELPGQFINCTYKYINKLNAKQGTTINYDWRANSLNPYNKSNIKIFGKSAFKDDYGYLKKHSNKWLWGSDKTGNLFKSKNILWYHNYIQTWCKDSIVDIVTGDAGIDTTTTTMRDQQLLEFSQCICCLAACTLGSSTIIKTFTPFHANNTDSDLSTGYFINLIYLYAIYFEEVNLFKPLSSRPVAGEFYVVAKGFKGINKQDLSKLCKVIDTFKLNQCIFKKDSIPKNIILKVIEFLDKMKKLNCDIITRFNNLTICLNNKKNTELQNDDVNTISYSLTEDECNTVYNKLINNNTTKTNFTANYDTLQRHNFNNFIKKYNLL